MRYTRVLTLVLLLVGLSTSAGNAAPTGAGKTKAPLASCSVRSIKLTNSDTVSASGYCVIGGRRQPAALRYTYRQSDYYGNICGSAITGPGSSFSLKYPQAYAVDVVFTATSTTKLNGKYVRKTTPDHQLNTGSQTMVCGKRYPYTLVPDTHQVCEYAFTNGSVCGVPQKLVGSVLTPFPPMAQPPFWGSMPYMDPIDHTIWAPSFDTVSGLCTEQPDGSSATLWGATVVGRKWECADGTSIVPVWYIYLAPDAVSGDGPQPRPSCRAGAFNQPGAANTGGLPLGGVFTHFSIPTDWHGRVDVELQMEVVDSSGAIIASEYSDNEFWNDEGTVNGCPQVIAAGN